MTSYLRAALMYVWAVIGCVALVILLLPVVAPDEVIRDLAPQCQSKQLDGTPCVLCGMTDAFMKLSRGDVHGARDANRGSLWLYACLLLNQACLATVLARASARGRLGALFQTNEEVLCRS